ncbi:MAG: hypothetical protein LBQ39_03295 [Tannerellaceae bacterium]|jgi:hypothetical protein|nr:hypothetical protein [Tannerellaceae bacterium]
MKHTKLFFLYSSLFFLFMACDGRHDSVYAPGSTIEVGGSMARFAVCGDYLYTVDNSTLRTFDLSDAGSPAYMDSKDQFLDFGVETIFPMDTLLFLGSQTGMYIYNVTRPDFPQQIARVSHITSCDPVVASGNYAYVTLNSEHSWCGRSVDELQIYDLSDLYNPQLVRTETGFKHPGGLGIDGNKLFICDNGLKIYDVSDPQKPVWTGDLTHIPQADGIEAYDVIPLNGLLLVVGNGGLYQFDYRGEKITFVSKINVSPEN